MNTSQGLKQGDDLNLDRFSYSRVKSDTTGVVHLVYAAEGSQDAPDVEITLESTLSEAIQAIGPSGSIAWILDNQPVR